MDNIEEVEKAIARAKAIAITLKRPLDEVLREEICHLFSQPLDDKALRERHKELLEHIYWSLQIKPSTTLGIVEQALKEATNEKYD